MASDAFNLVSHWHLDLPVEPVWQALNHPEQWPGWWRAVKRVEAIAEGDATGLGAVRRFTWGTALPYQIDLELTVSRVETMRVLEARVRGELDGIGRWTIAPEGTRTHVRYDWEIVLTKPWQRACAPLLRPVFGWNHRVVMGWGYEGLCKHLGIAPSSRS
jgi:Polyketide cyclase / dehydrase and lipid transport